MLDGSGYILLGEHIVGVDYHDGNGSAVAIRTDEHGIMHVEWECRWSVIELDRERLIDPQGTK